MPLSPAAKFLAPSLLALATLTLQAQGHPPQTTTPPPGNVPITSQTSAPGATNPITASPETKSEKKHAKTQGKNSGKQSRKQKKQARERADSSLPPA